MRTGADHNFSFRAGGVRALTRELNTLDPTQAISKVNQPRVVIGIIFAAFLVLGFARCYTNLPWVDEGWFFDPVYNWIVHGHTGTTVMEGKGFPWQGIERHQFWQPPMHLIWDAIWLKIFGLSLVAFRSLSLFAGVWLLIAWLYILKHFHAPLAVRLLAFAFIGTDYAVLRAASDGRTDMISAAFGLGAVATYLRFRDRSFTSAVLLSQTLVVCGGMTHPIGGVVYLALLIYFFVKGKDWQKLRPVHITLGLLPYAIGVAGWGLYIAQDPQLFRKIFFGSSAAGRLSGMLNPLLALQREIVIRYLSPFGLFGHTWVLKAKLLIPIVYLTGALLVVLLGPVRRQPFLRPFIAMWAIASITVFLVDNQRNGTYMVHLLPHYAVLLASLIYWVYQNMSAARPVLMLFAASFLALQIGGSMYIILTNPYGRQYKPVTDYVLQHARPGDRIVGTSELGFGIGFDRLHDDMALGYYVDKQPNIIVLCPRYEAWYQEIRGTAIHDFIQARLLEFQPVFGTNAFQVLMPKGFSAGRHSGDATSQQARLHP